ncbi:chromosome condensation complex Condensin, subunit G [Collariella sp. IMI 366227]|nr:chromosome condensation complex Condensin, subunit G [Collariella sp. IMI 366227]
MPPRASTRSTRSSAGVSAKSAAASSRASTVSRSPSVVNADIPPETPETALRIQVASVFREAQRTTASHRKLAVTLRKIQEACCYEPTSLTKRSGPAAAAAAASDFDEDDFNAELVRCVLRVMPIKKSEAVGEKTVRFLGLFLRHAVDKDNEVLGQLDADTSIMPETPATRLTGILIETVLPLMTAKDKFVRYRSTQLISHVINSLDAIDDDLFQKLRSALLKRIRDKEAMVRVQAVLGLGRLAGNQIEAEPDSDESEHDAASGLLEKLLEVLQNDPSADVRRSLLVNLPILPTTLPFLLERARDQDAATRRAVYSRLLPALGDFRHLSLSMREKLLRWGLRDRDENVRKAAGRLFRERWIEDCAGTPPPAETGQPAEVSPPNLDALLELLERIDVINSGGENGVGLEAMRGFWDGRPDYREAMFFDDTFFETLSAESVFVVRTFNDFCRNEGNGKYESLIEEKLPEVTKVAFYLERYIKVLIDAIKRTEEQEVEEDEEEDTAEQEFIVEQLLHIALTLDYSDEVGRRKMFSLLRQTLSIPELPEEVTKLTVSALRDICAPDAAGEKEFCSIVLEAVADVHDTIVDDLVPENDDESFHSARSEVSSDSTPTKRGKSKSPELSEEEAAAKAIKEIMINMKCLHIVQCMLSHVSGDLQQNDQLITMLNNLVVPAVRSHEAPVRERGLVFYIKALRSGAKHPEVQAAATVAASKLLLGRVVSSDADVAAELLRTLVVAYFEPASNGNQSVRQALNYFLPVFCYSRPENQDLMRSVALDALHTLYNVREGFEDDDADIEDEMVSLGAIGACLVDWTDPRKDVLERLGGNVPKEEKKILPSLLSKLYISPASSEDKTREVYAEVCEAVESQLLPDATGRNALYKIHISLGKIVNALDAAAEGAAAAAAGGRYQRSVSRASSMGLGSDAGAKEKTVLQSTERQSAERQVQIKEEEEEEEDDEDDAATVVHRTPEEQSLVSELLSEEEL